MKNLKTRLPRTAGYAGICHFLLFRFPLLGSYQGIYCPFILKPFLIQNLPSDHEIRFLHDTRFKSQIIYISVLACFLGCIMALPFIRISLSVQGRGIIRPVSELAEVRVIPSAIGALLYTLRRPACFERRYPADAVCSGNRRQLEFRYQELRKYAGLYQ